MTTDACAFPFPPSRRQDLASEAANELSLWRRPFPHSRYGGIAKVMTAVMMNLRLLNQAREEMRAYVHGKHVLDSDDRGVHVSGPSLSEFALAKTPLASIRKDAWGGVARSGLGSKSMRVLARHDRRVSGSGHAHSHSVVVGKGNSGGGGGGGGVSGTGAVVDERMVGAGAGAGTSGDAGAGDGGVKASSAPGDTVTVVVEGRETSRTVLTSGDTGSGYADGLGNDVNDLATTAAEEVVVSRLRVGLEKLRPLAPVMAKLAAGISASLKHLKHPLVVSAQDVDHEVWAALRCRAVGSAHRGQRVFLHFSWTVSWPRR